MANTRFLFAVQDSTGRELVAQYYEVEKVSTISATFDGQTVKLLDSETVIGWNTPGNAEGDLWLYRWEADDKLAEPVKHRVKLV